MIRIRLRKTSWKLRLLRAFVMGALLLVYITLGMLAAYNTEIRVFSFGLLLMILLAIGSTGLAFGTFRHIWDNK